MRLAVVGGGIAGCAAAWSAAQAGCEVRLYEASKVLGGLAVRGDHRWLCGLAAIDAEEPILLEATLSQPLLDACCCGRPQRRGRVWLWPSQAGQLASGLKRLLLHAGVRLFLGQRVSIAESGQAPAILCAQRPWDCDWIIDASGTAHIAPRQLARRPAQAWAALRGLVTPSQGGLPKTRAERLAWLRRAQEVAQSALVDCELLDAQHWRLSLDVPPDLPWARALQAWQDLAQHLGLQGLTQTACLLQRDQGGLAGTLDCQGLFAQESRQLCWAAWPEEFHHPQGIDWVWPERPFYGVPVSITQPPSAPPWYRVVGTGMAAEARALAALRVCGSAWNIAAALSQRLARAQPDSNSKFGPGSAGCQPAP